MVLETAALATRQKLIQSIESALRTTAFIRLVKVRVVADTPLPYAHAQECQEHADGEQVSTATIAAATSRSKISLPGPESKKRAVEVQHNHPGSVDRLYKAREHSTGFVGRLGAILIQAAKELPPSIHNLVHRRNTSESVFAGSLAYVNFVVAPCVPDSHRDPAAKSASASRKASTGQNSTARLCEVGCPETGRHESRASNQREGIPGDWSTAPQRAGNCFVRVRVAAPHDRVDDTFLQLGRAEAGRRRFAVR